MGWMGSMDHVMEYLIPENLPRINHDARDKAIDTICSRSLGTSTVACTEGLVVTSLDCLIRGKLVSSSKKTLVHLWNKCLAKTTVATDHS